MTTMAHQSMPAVDARIGEVMRAGTIRFYAFTRPNGTYLEGATVADVTRQLAAYDATGDATGDARTEQTRAL